MSSSISCLGFIYDVAILRKDFSQNGRPCVPKLLSFFSEFFFMDRRRVFDRVGQIFLV